MNLSNRLAQELPQRGPQCPSALELEAWVAGDGPKTLEAHCGACAECGGYVERLRAEQEAFFKSHTPELFARKMAHRKEARKSLSLRWFWLAAPILPLFLWVSTFSLTIPDDIRLKGASFFTVYYQRAATHETGEASNDMRLAPGDSLRFAFSAPRDGYGVVLNLDGTGKASSFFPFGGSAAQPLKAGQSLLTNDSVVLDHAPGPEWVVAVFQEKPFDVAALLSQLSQLPKDTDVMTLQCGSCIVSALRIQKTP